jgi:protein arginine N-methyltransferase 5
MFGDFGSNVKMSNEDGPDVNNSRKPPSIGADLFFSEDLQTSLDECRAAMLDFAILPLVHPRLERKPNSTVKRSELLSLPLTRSDTLLDSNQWSSMIVGRLSKWMRLDGVDSSEIQASEAALREEVAWATHLNLSAVLAPSPPSLKQCSNYARQVNHLLVKAQQGLNIWLEIESNDWAVWNKFRTLCDYSLSLHVALKIDITGIEATSPDEEHYEEQKWLRWMGEPVRCLLLSTKEFIPNTSGYPTLPPKTRKLIVRYYERGAQFVITGKPRHPNGLLPYQMYLPHLCKKSSSIPTEREHFESPFYDYLQIPLQPLGDNLESSTYETFEKDPVKYARYEEATKQALISAAKKAPTGENLVIMVVGAGRGPLIRAALRGARAAFLDERVKIYGVEKNPNAIVTLLNSWPKGNPDKVQIICKDMRDWEAPEKADIIVSELLGSWGDNELSPECLQGVERFLKPESGVSIPCSYQSFVSPISSQKVWSEVRGLSKGPIDVDPVTAASGVQRFETPYVVRLFNIYHIDDPKVVFDFDHRPRRETDDIEQQEGQDVLERYSVVDFKAKADSVIHGFAGYFTAQLFENVDISIHPGTFSTGMFSWFPLFIPIREPISVKAEETITCSFWRRRSKAKVWYEWSIETESQATPIHNPTGRSYAVNL